MNHYYVIFDHATSQVGFAPLVSSPTMKAAVVAGTTPETSYYESTTTDLSEKTKIVIITLLAIILIGVPAILIYLVYCNKKPEVPAPTDSSSSAPAAQTTSEVT